MRILQLLRPVLCIASCWPIWKRYRISFNDYAFPKGFASAPECDERFRRAKDVYGSWALWSWVGLTIVGFFLHRADLAVILYNFVALVVILVATSRRAD